MPGPSTRAPQRCLKSVTPKRFTAAEAPAHCSPATLRSIAQTLPTPASVQPPPASVALAKGPAALQREGRLQTRIWIS